MILVCTSCIGQIDYIPLRHYQYVTNVSDTYYPSKYIQRFRSPFLVLEIVFVVERVFLFPDIVLFWVLNFLVHVLEEGVHKCVAKLDYSGPHSCVSKVLCPVVFEK